MPRLSPNLDALDRDNGQAGMIAPSGQYFVTTTQALASNVCRISRFVPSRNMTITKIGFVTQAFSAGDTADPACDVGIYDSSLAKIVSSGATTGKLNGATGARTIDITSTALTAGTVYYAALAAGSLGTTTCSLLAATYVSGGGRVLFGTGDGVYETEAFTSSYTLPATLSSGSASAIGFLLALRES